MAQNDSGAVAVEFALVAPILLMILLSVMEGAFSLHQRFQLDHILRAGAEAAKTDPGAPAVLAIMEELAAAEDVAVGVAVQAPQRYCLCVTAPAVAPASAPDCATPCPNGSTPGVAYVLSASLPYGSIVTPNMVLFTITSTLSIQVK